MNKSLLFLSVLFVSFILVGCSQKNDTATNDSEKEVSKEEQKEETKNKSEQTVNEQQAKQSSETDTVNVKDNPKMNDTIQKAIAGSIESGEIKNIKKNVVYEVGPQTVKVVSTKEHGDIIVHDASLQQPKSVVEVTNKTFVLQNLIDKQLAFYYQDKALGFVTVSLLKNKAINYQAANKYSLLIGNNEYLFAENPYDQEILTTMIFEEIDLSKILAGEIFLNLGD